MSKLNPKRVPMKEQLPEERRQNFTEVALGYTAEEAVAEAQRCLVCKKPACVKGCPVGINIPEFIRLLAEQNFAESAKALKEDNALPAICGRVCPQETQCEEKCIVGKKGEPVAIGKLERFVADYDRLNSSHQDTPVPMAAPSGFRVAVVGSGPAGLTCARELARMGHEVVIFEALHKPGGVLVYGIPEFRLPNDIVEYEVNQLKKMGVEIKLDTVIGLTYTLQELFEDGFEAIFIGTGAGLPKFLGIPGENYCGVVSANEFLTRVNLMEGHRFPEADTPVYVGEKTVVLGAGNTAMDAARAAVRLGAREVHIVYRRSSEEMPARAEEAEHAKHEGINFEFLTAPLAITGDEKGWVKGLECQRMGLGEPDDSGRRRPVPVAGSEFTIPCNMVIYAVGSGINSMIFRESGNLQRTRHGTVVVDENTGATSIPGIFAGGDVAIGAATVILAMGTGKRAANGINEYLNQIKGFRLHSGDS